MNESLTVSQFVELINFTFDTLEGVTVQGEVAEFKIIQNKWVTFLLKDEDSSINCFMPVWHYRTPVENGMLIKAAGTPRLRNKGFFSFVVSTLAPVGEGSLKRSLELLQKKLAAEGLFEEARKRPLPRFPKHIALITSRDAAAYNDFIKVLTHRLGGLTISFIHTQVQGEGAPTQIIKALEVANLELTNVDVIVLVRGGGSLEDLMAFNDEGVVRAVAASRTPTIVGIGHERDITLAELAADVRASTPSNAAELLVPSRSELLAHVNQLEHKLGSGLRGIIEEAQYTLTNQITILRRSVEQILQEKMNQLQQLSRVLISLSPEATLKRGYSLTKTTKGKIVRSIKNIQKNDQLITMLPDGTFNSTVIKVASGKNNL